MRQWSLFVSVLFIIGACRPALAFVVGRSTTRPQRYAPFLLLLPTTTQRQAGPQQQRAAFAMTPISFFRAGNRQLRPSYQKARINDNDDDDDEDDREFARVRRGRGGGDKNERRFDNDEKAGDDEPSRRASDNPYYRAGDEYDDDDDDEWDFIDDLDEQWDGDLDDMEKHDLLGNVLIPNPILDNIDPDGAAERFPELAKDPRFWFDIVLFLAFLDFLSFVGPRDPFPDLPLPYGPM